MNLEWTQNVLAVSVQKKQWDILQVGVSNQQPYLAIVISVGILDNFRRMSMSDHMEVR